MKFFENFLIWDNFVFQIPGIDDSFWLGLFISPIWVYFYLTATVVLIEQYNFVVTS